MGTTFGPRTLTVTGPILSCRTNPGMSPNKPGGVTIDWSAVSTTGDGTVTATGGVPIPSGVKYIDLGTTLLKETGGGNAGLYAPANTAGANGLQTVDGTRRGEAFVTDRLVLETEDHSNHLGEVFDQGYVFKDRLKIGGTGQPTEANFEAMFPGISFIND